MANDLSVQSSSSCSTSVEGPELQSVFTKEERQALIDSYVHQPLTTKASGTATSPIYLEYQFALVVGKADWRPMKDYIDDKGFIPVKKGFGDSANIGISFIYHEPDFDVARNGYLGNNEPYYEIIYAVEVENPQPENGIKGPVYYPFAKVRVSTQESFDIGAFVDVPKIKSPPMSFCADKGEVGFTAMGSEGELLVNLSWEGSSRGMPLLPEEQTFVNNQLDSKGNPIPSTYSFLHYASRYRGVQAGVFNENPRFSGQEDILRITDPEAEILNQAAFNPQLIFYTPYDTGKVMSMFAPDLIPK